MAADPRKRLQLWSIFSDELAAFIGRPPRSGGWLQSPATTSLVVDSGSEVRRYILVDCANSDANIPLAPGPALRIAFPLRRHLSYPLSNQSCQEMECETLDVGGHTYHLQSKIVGSILQSMKSR